MTIKNVWPSVPLQQQQQQQQKSKSLTMLSCVSILVITMMTLMLKMVVIRAAAIQPEFWFLPYNWTADCTARECDLQINRQHLLQMQRYMDPRANPCEDFHQYACGNWQKEHIKGTTTMQLADERVTQRFVHLFESWLQQDVDDIERSHVTTPMSAGEEVREKLLKYYKVCKALEDSGGGGGGVGSGADKPSLELSQYISQMYDMNLWRLQDFNWSQLLGDLGRYGYSSHFIHHYPRVNNSTSIQLYIQPHELNETLPWNAEIVAVLKEFNNGEDVDVLKQELLQFEQQVINLVSTDEDAAEYQEYTVTELMTHTGTLIDWNSYLNKILGGKVLSADKILVQNLHEIKAIAVLLQQTEPKILLLYTMARFLNYLQQPQIGNFLHTNANSYKCIKHMRKNLYLPMNYIYELEYYARIRPKSDAIIFDVFHKLKREFSLILDENAMNFSETELQWLQLKVKETRINIGNLPVNVTAQFYSDYVRNLNFTDNFYYNHLHALQHYFGHVNFLISLPDTDTNNPMFSFHLSPPTIEDIIDATPYFNCRNNMIIITYTYLQLPYYSAEFEDTLIYGDLANTLGHELIHGFENKFLFYDAYGAAAPDFDVLIQSNPKFNSNLACMEEDTYKDTDLLSERIADVSGTHLAIRAFLHDPVIRRRNGRLFFLQFAQFFCGSTEEEEFRKQDPYHELDNMRLNYVAAQMPEFAEVFSCPRGSKLNPDERCRMW